MIRRKKEKKEGMKAKSMYVLRLRKSESKVELIKRKYTNRLDGE